MGSMLHVRSRSQSTRAGGSAYLCSPAPMAKVGAVGSWSIPWTQAKRSTSMFEQGAGDIRNVVLVHGGFVDGSGWEGVYRSLRKQGYKVTIVQHPTTSLADDVRAVQAVLAAQDGPAVLVGHSYGG